MPDIIGAIKSVFQIKDPEEKRGQRTVGEEGAWRMRADNSAGLIPAKDKAGVVPMDVAIDSIYRLLARGGIKAAAQIQANKLKDVRRDITEGAVGAGARKIASKVGLKQLAKTVTMGLEFWDEAANEIQIELAIRDQGLATMIELLERRAVGHGKTKTKFFYTRRGAAPLTTDIVKRNDD